MKRLILALALLFAALPVFAAEDFSGKWSGSFSATLPDGTPVKETIYLVLTQKGAELTGTAGPNEANQWKIQAGKVDGNNLSFMVENPDKAVARIALTLADGHLKGDFTAEKGSEKITAKVDVTRVK